MIRLSSILLFVLLVRAVPVAAGPAPTCLSDSQCADGDLCNGIERCVAGTCVPPSAPLACDDADPCTSDSCNPAAGCAHGDTLCPATCGPGDDGLRCSDGTACTTGDTCSGGSCVGAPLACDDADPCTVDACDPVLGCTYAEQPDPPACLSTAQCASSADHTPCVADGDPCTQDGCLEGACRVGLNQIVRQCADLDACNGDEFCSPVKGCEPGPSPVCDDGQLCNGTESCVPATGCTAGTNAPDGTPCDDSQSCTDTDACAAGACLGTALDCDDADGATADLCLEGTGCLHCGALTHATLNLRFPTPAKPGRFASSGRFVPGATVDPAGPAGADLVVHDGATIVQSSHVAGSAFVVNGAGTVFRFVDRTGTQAHGLERLRIKTAAPGTPHQLGAKGATTATALTHAPMRSVTFRAGPVCATATLACSAMAGGRRDRCK
jgi:hypothetical protein